MRRLDIAKLAAGERKRSVPAQKNRTASGECRCQRCREHRENPKPLPKMVPVSQEMKNWIKAEAEMWRAEQAAAMLPEAMQ